MKKDTKFDNERQLLLLKKYYQVDEENKIITINVHYDKALIFLIQVSETIIILLLEMKLLKM